MKLLIIESQGKVEKLQSILGDGWKVSASLGHVCDLPDKEIGVEPPKYKPQYRLSERGASLGTYCCSNRASRAAAGMLISALRSSAPSP